MTYTFKLSRRLARLRDAAVITASLFTLSCTDGPNGPGSTPPATDPTSVVIAPDSVTVGANQTVQFEVVTDTSAGVSLTAASTNTAGGSKGRGQGRSKVVSLAVTPVSSSVAPGGSQSFDATATLNDGSLVQPSLTWAASGGTVNASGKYTAGMVDGNYRVVATASNGVADTATVTITAIAPILAQIMLSPTSASLPVGGSKQFTVTGSSTGGATIPVASKYAVTGGTISSTGMYQASQTPGSYRIIATDTVSSLADTSAVTVTALGVTLQSVVLTPATASVAQGAKQQFSASGQMSDGSTVPISPSFTATGGSISSSGEYTAGSTAGTYRVIAADQASGNADTSSITVTAPTPPPPPSPSLQAVVLTPTNVSLEVGATQQFSATGKMSDGSTSAVTVTWSALGGTISSTGLYTAGSVAGSYRVIATQTGGTLADTSAVSITTTAPPVPPAGNLPTPLRTINVATSAALTAALQNALPGDRIVLAPGTYSANGFFAARSGTASNRIVLTGPRTAVLTGSGGDQLIVTASYWIFNGFRITAPTNGGINSHNGGSNNIYDSLEVDHTGTAAIYINGNVTGNIVRYCNLHDAGLNGSAGGGEGVYLGSSFGTEATLNTWVHHNTVGPNIASDGIEAKVGANNSLIEFNTVMKDITIRSDNNNVNDNILTIGGPSTALINNHCDGTNCGADNNTYHRNHGSLATKMFNISNGTGVVVCSDNVAVAPTVMGTTTTVCP